MATRSKSIRIPPTLGDVDSGVAVYPPAAQSVPRRSFVTAKDLLWLVYLYPVRLAAAVLPVRVFLLINRLVDPVCQWLMLAQKRRIRRHFEAAKQFHGLDHPADLLANAVVSNIVRRTTDDLILDKLAGGEMACKSLAGLGHLKGALSQGRGVMVVGGHFYANRVASRYLQQLGYPMLSVRNCRPSDTMMGWLGERFLHRRYIEYLRGVIGDEVFIQDPECSLKIFKRLRAGGIVHIYLDAGVTALRDKDEARQPIWLPFLGTRRPFPTGLMQITRLSGCEVIPMLCLGDSRGFSIEFAEPASLMDIGSETFASANLPKLIGDLETRVLDNPEQWELWGIMEQATFLTQSRRKICAWPTTTTSQ